MKRTPLKRRKPMSRMSKLRRLEGRIYTKQRADFLIEHPWCEVRVSTVTGNPVHRHDFGINTKPCGKRSTQVHHVRQRGKYYLDKKYWLATEFVHHRWIEDNKKEAKRLGYIERVYDKH